MNILVTGSKGFIASHLIPKLENLGHKVIGMDIKNDKEEDVRSYVNCLEYVILDIDYVIHLASAIDVQDSIADPIYYADNNEMGLINMLDACIDKGIKSFVFASSAAAQNPESPYGATKLNGETWCNVFHKCYGLSTVSLRFFNVFGNGAVNGVIPKWMSMIKRGESPVINGDGGTNKGFCICRGCG
jgi:UDP-N-acetylglucosamine 4-epimerase